MTIFDTTSILSTNQSLHLTVTEEGLVVAVNGKEMITLAGNYNLFIECLENVDGVSTYEEVVRKLSSLGKDPAEVEEILRFCAEENIIRQAEYSSLRDKSVTLDDYSYTKWDRQIRNFATLPGITDHQAVSFQDKLEKSHVAILGVGGVGSYVALGLSMMGVGKISLIDFDSIELSNTSRQVLFTESSIGQLKIDVARNEIAKHNPRTIIECVNQKIESPEDLDRALDSIQAGIGSLPDLLFIAADTPRGMIHYIADESCYRRGVPSFNLGPHGFSEMTMGPLSVPGVTPSYSERVPKQFMLNMNEEVEQINERFTANIMDPYNALIAKMGVVEAIKFLTGYQEPEILNTAITIDTSTWTIERYEY